MNVALLSKVKEFHLYFGLLYNHNNVDSPDLLFTVTYHDDSRGIVRDGPWVLGEHFCVHHLILSKLKICQAKDLVPWEEVPEVQKEGMLQLEIDSSY